LPRGLRPCRSGGASSAALRPPARATEQGVPRRGPSLSPAARCARAGASTPHRGTPARDPHAPAPSASVRWAVFAPTPAPRGSAAGCLRLGKDSRSAAGPPSCGRGGRQSAGTAGGHRLLRPRAPDGRAAPGCRWLRPSVSCEGGEQRGAPARIALSGRGRRSMRARARGRPGPHLATRGTGKKDSTQWKKNQSDLGVTRGVKERQPHAVRTKITPLARPDDQEGEIGTSGSRMRAGAADGPTAATPEAG
jgi:hypothetical protein